MNWLEIAYKIAQLVISLVGIWRKGGGEVVKQVLADNHKRVCDEHCQIELRKAQGKA